MSVHPFKYSTYPKSVGATYDNIIYINNFVIYRPNYTIDKRGDTYSYSPLYIVDLYKSFVDLYKFNDLLCRDNIDLSQEPHTFTDNTRKLLILLDEASSKFELEIPNTENNYLHRIQYSKCNKLLITRKVEDNPRDYILVDLNTLKIIYAGGNKQIKKLLKTLNIVYDVQYIYGYSEYLLGAMEYECKSKVLKDELPANNNIYDYIRIEYIKTPKLLFIENDIKTINWYINNIYKPTQIIYELLPLPIELIDLIDSYIISNLYKYINNIEILINKIKATCDYYLKKYSNEDIAYIEDIPKTELEFRKIVKLLTCLE